MNMGMIQARHPVFDISNQIYELVTVEPDPSGREKKGRKAAKTAPVHTEAWTKIPSTTPLWEESSHSHFSHSMC